MVGNRPPSCIRQWRFLTVNFGKIRIKLTLFKIFFQALQSTSFNIVGLILRNIYRRQYFPRRFFFRRIYRRVSLFWKHSVIIHAQLYAMFCFQLILNFLKIVFIKFAKLRPRLRLRSRSIWTWVSIDFKTRVYCESEIQTFFPIAVCTVFKQ